MTILITGVSGHIGSATAARFLSAGHRVIGIDNFSGGNRKGIKSLNKYYEIDFYEVDLGDYDSVMAIAKHHEIDVVFHFAASLDDNFVGRDNLDFYENNMVNLVKLLKVMRETNINHIVYPSSIFAEYGFSFGGTYVKTKVLSEYVIQDYARTNPKFSYAILRYCNIAGYYSKAFLGEYEQYSVIKNIARLACGKPNLLDVLYNDNYSFLHIDDVSEINFRAASHLLNVSENMAYTVINERYYKVKELVKIMEEVSGKKIDVDVKTREIEPVFHSDVRLPFQNFYKLQYSIHDVCRNIYEHEMRF